MIEINLLPGAKKSNGRGTGFSIPAVVSSVKTKVKDLFMLAAVGSVTLAALAIGGLHFTQSRRATSLEARADVAQKDSIRFAGILKERRRAEAKRDSVVRELDIIRSIDNDRFVWPHIMDEVSRALPPFTWLKSLAATSTAPTPTQPAGAANEKESKKKDGAPPPPEALKFRVIGNTVDIQALTRFMKLLEASPFIQNVQLAKSEAVISEGKEVTEFQLDAEYERPDKASLTTAPVSLSVR
ncbi:MAG: PilN domain-containing protein [Gemmatimonadaceae bacterium]